MRDVSLEQLVLNMLKNILRANCITDLAACQQRGRANGERLFALKKLDVAA